MLHVVVRMMQVPRMLSKRASSSSSIGSRITVDSRQHTHGVAQRSAMVPAYFFPAGFPMDKRYVPKEHKERFRRLHDNF